ncbi:MAG: endonuclease/exonuclease/phosphatase family protein [Bacteroidota bacterium]
MRRIFPVLWLFFLPVFTALSQDLTVATFNAEFLNKSRVHLKFGLPFDMKNASEEEQQYWEVEANRAAKLKEASANVASMIKQMNADVVTLTEVGGAEDLEVLLSELGQLGVTYDHWSVCDCTDPFTGQHVAVLSKYPLKEVWPQIPGRALYLEETDGDSEGETGISKGMKVTVVVEEKEIDLFVLHLKSERGGYDSDAKRLAQANIARRAIIGQLNLGRQVIVAGDLNSEKGTESIYRIRGFDDVYEELIQTGHTQYFESTEVRWTYNYRGEPEQIDHILVSPGLTARDGIKTRILVTDEKVSDHNPVIVELTLK